MRRQIIARLSGGAVTVESSIVDVEGRPQHRYVLHGGPHDGLEFEHLSALSAHLLELQQPAVSDAGLNPA